MVPPGPLQVMEGWPCVTPALQWAPGCPLYVMGQYAALQVGPLLVACLVILVPILTVTPDPIIYTNNNNSDYIIMIINSAESVNVSGLIWSR